MQIQISTDKTPTALAAHIVTAQDFACSGCVDRSDIHAGAVGLDTVERGTFPIFIAPNTLYGADASCLAGEQVTGGDFSETGRN